MSAVRVTNACYLIRQVLSLACVERFERCGVQEFGSFYATEANDGVLQ